MSSDQVPQLVCVGRIGVDLYPLTAGRFAQTSDYRRSLGGSATNVAVAAARLGVDVALVTRVGDDTAGRWCRAAAADFGVDVGRVGVATSGPTPLVLAELDPPDAPTIHFWRDERAPDLQLDADDLPDALVRSCGILWITGTGLSARPSRDVTIAALERRGGAAHAIFDLDWRPSLWRDPDQAPAAYRRALAAATIAVGGLQECEVATGPVASAEQAAERLHELGVDVAVVKLGADGVLVSERGEVTRVAARAVDVVCGLGAGDAFGGAFCAWLLDGASVSEAVRAGNAAGAIVAGRLACADAMPTREELQRAMEEHRAGIG